MFWWSRSTAKLVRCVLVHWTLVLVILTVSTPVSDHSLQAIIHIGNRQLYDVECVYILPSGGVPEHAWDISLHHYLYRMNTVPLESATLWPSYLGNGEVEFDEVWGAVDVSWPSNDLWWDDLANDCPIGGLVAAEWVDNEGTDSNCWPCGLVVNRPLRGKQQTKIVHHQCYNHWLTCWGRKCLLDAAGDCKDYLSSKPSSIWGLLQGPGGLWGISDLLFLFIDVVRDWARGEQLQRIQTGILTVASNVSEQVIDYK